MIIERHPLLDGWKSTQKLAFKHVTKEAISANNIVYVTPDNYSKVRERKRELGRGEGRERERERDRQTRQTNRGKQKKKDTTDKD